MPLQLWLQGRWEKTLDWNDKPGLVTGLRVVACLAWLVTVFFSYWQLLNERFMQCRSKEKRITASFSIRLFRQIVFIPMLLGTVATLSLFLPPLAYGLELVISIGTVLQVSAVLFHCLEVFDQPPYTQAIVDKLPRRRWWCGGKCGGYADALPWMSYVFGQSKEAQKITIGQLSTAYYMVGVWIFVSLVGASYTLSFSVVPKDMVERNGWCYSQPEMSMASRIIITVLVVWSSLFGMSGFGIIAGASSLAMTGSKAVHARKIMRRSSLAQLYVSIPLIKAILGLLPVQFSHPALAHYKTVASNATTRNVTNEILASFPPSSILPLNVTTESLVMVTTKTVNKVLTCPVYDEEVMNLFLYACSVSLIMAIIAVYNWKLNPISDWKQDLRYSHRTHTEVEQEDVRGSEDEDSEGQTAESSSSEA